MTRTQRTWTIAGIAILLLLLALPKTGLLTKSPKAQPERPAERVMEVRAMIVRSEKVGGKVATVGTVLPSEEVEIRSEVSGKVERILFREGGRVKKGDVLVKINDAELRAQLARARAREDLARQQEERQRQLFEKNLTSKEEYDNALTNLNIARAEVQLIQAQLDKTEIKAPFDGALGLRFISEGSYITPTTLITTLQDTRTVKIDFAIPERYAGIVRVGDRIAFTTEHSAQPLTATVYAVEPKLEQQTRTLRMRARRSNADGALVPGAYSSVEMTLRERVAIMIPSYALVPELKGQKVFVYRNGRAEEQPVDVGLRTDATVEITKGLSAGDTLILSGILQLRSGVPVRVGLQQTPELAQ